MSLSFPSGTADKLRLAAIASIAVAVLVLGLKYLAYWVTGSVALYSDALESIVNLITALVALYAIHVSAQPADRRHQFGHHKAEYFSAVIEGVLIVVAALLIFHEAYDAFRHPRTLSDPMRGLVINGLATAVNAGWSYFLLTWGRRQRSPALVASGAHLWGDVMTTAGVLVGLGAAWLTGRWALDSLIALLVAVNILRLGWKVFRDSVGGLMDEALAAPEVERITAIVRHEMGGALQFHDLRTRRGGPRPFVELHLVVPGAMRVDAAHAICDRIEAAVQRELPGADVVVHVEPESELRESAER